MRRARPPVVLVSKLFASRIVREIHKMWLWKTATQILRSEHKARLCRLGQQIVLAAEQPGVSNRCELADFAS